MKKIITTSILAALTMTMLLPVAGAVNAGSVNLIVRQGNPIPPGSGSGGGHVMLRQGNPIPPGSGSGGGH